METIKKNSIWICLTIAIAITSLIGIELSRIIEDNVNGEEIGSMAFGLLWVLGCIFFGSWIGLGWLLDKMLP